MVKHIVAIGSLATLLLSLSVEASAAPTRSEADQYVGYQRYPSRAGMWKGAYRHETSPRIGASRTSLPYLTFSNLVQSDGQAGPGAVFSHELIAVAQKNETLVMNGLGDVLAIFDTTRRGYQTWPQAARSWAMTSTDQSTVTLNLFGGGVLEFKKVTTNFRGDALYLLSSVTSQGGKRWAIQFSWDDTSQTPTYTQIGPVAVRGSLKGGKGGLSFRNADAPLTNTSYSFGRTKGSSNLEVRDAANALIARLTFSENRFLVAMSNRYGYSSTQSFTKTGLLEKQCSALNVCVSTSYQKDTITKTANTSLYPVIYSFKDGLLIAVRAEGLQKTLSYIKTDKPWQPYVLSSVDATSPSGSALQQLISYDDKFRLVSIKSNLGDTKFSYADPHFPDVNAVVSRQAGNTVASYQMSYNAKGMLQSVRDNLQNRSAISSSRTFSYDKLDRIVSIEAPGHKVNFAYGDANNPDQPTQVTVNGVANTHYKYNPQGYVTAIRELSSRQAWNFARNIEQAVTQQTYVAPNGNRYSTEIGFQAPGYVNGVMQSLRLASGPIVDLPSWRGEWDSDYRNIVRLTTFDPNIKQEPKGPPDNHIWFEQESRDVEEGMASPKGKSQGGDGCSPCSYPHYKNGLGESLHVSRAASSVDSHSVTRLPPAEEGAGL